MTDDTNTASEGKANGAGAASPQDQAPRLHVLAQYVKDLSFENPGAPDSLGSNSQESPSMNASVNVQAKQRSNTDFECDLKISVTSKQGESTLFIVELVYSGLFQLTNIPQEQIQQIIFIECPRQLFPFARRVIADATRDGGFPPLLLDPIDFVALYQQQIAAQQAQQDAGASVTADATES